MYVLILILMKILMCVILMKTNGILLLLMCESNVYY